MRLETSTSPFSFGDTSFRRADFSESFPIVMPILNEYKKTHPKWNRPEQIEFYAILMDKSELFSREENDIDGKRGRTLTNSMMKPGFVTKDRFIGETGLHWVENNLVDADTIEQLFLFTPSTLAFTRQLLKVRIYEADNTGNKFFRPFLFLLNMLAKYGEMPKGHLLYTTMAIRPSFTEKEIRDVINDYQQVVDNKATFDDYFDQHFATALQFGPAVIENGSKQLQRIFNGDLLTDEELKRYFPNNNGPVYRERYQEFLIELNRFKTNHSQKSLETLIELSKNNTIKNSFGGGAAVFKARANVSVADFISNNSDNPLLTGNSYAIYHMFQVGKYKYLRSQYLDLNVRYLSMTGLVSTKNGYMSLDLTPIVNNILHIAQLTFVGDENYEQYEDNPNSPFYSDITMMSILNIDEVAAKNTIQTVLQQYGVFSIEELRDTLEHHKADKLTELIESKFDRERTIKILELFKKRRTLNDSADKAIRKAVTESSSGPTIFEFIVAIAWYHLNGKQLNIFNALNLEFDADMLPISHAPGGRGDIEFTYDSPKMNLLIEVTLMNPNNQKRSEMEPIIRHTTNLAVEADPVPTQGIFIANEIDTNVENVFRAMAFTELNSTETSGSVQGINLFALSISELNALLENNVSDQTILNVTNNNLPDSPVSISNEWRKPILAQMGI
ncbi:AlwI family type II restriction endonuclease [Fructobacillus fructosus]|uniref:AlwI family type II restriction endonuclease n=1 Tax=Fructobacillus fructosus TaxID=1631 RepID=UPI004033B04C